MASIRQWDLPATGVQQDRACLCLTRYIPVRCHSACLVQVLVNTQCLEYRASCVQSSPGSYCDFKLPGRRL